MKKKMMLLVPVTLAGSLLIEYYGWKIIEKMNGEFIFPGFTSPDTIKSVLLNSLGAWLFGFIILLPMLFAPGFRRNIKNKLHIPLYTGVFLFFIYMSVLIYIGLSS